jgi:predicted Zn-dependent protease
MSQRGTQLMAAGRYAEAVPVYRRLLASIPGNPGLLLNLGMALHLAGQDREALPQLEAALRREPDSLPASLFLGAARLRLGRAEAAVAPLQKAVALQPENREARALLVDALLALERHAEAEPHLRRLSRMAPSDPETWLALGKTYGVLAERAFEELRRLDPDSSFAFALAGEARLEQGRSTAAFQLYRQALERSPMLRGLHAAVAQIYRSTGHPDWAAIEDEKERRLPRADCAQSILECAFAAGKHLEMVGAASKSKAAPSYYWLARAYNELAGQAFARLAALPPSAPAHEWAATRRRREGRYAESVAEWRKAAALAPEDLQLKLELAVTLRLNQDLAEAQRVLEEVARAEAAAPEAHFLLGDLLLARQQPEQAIPFLEKALRLEPARPEIHGALGRAYALVGRPADAIPRLEQALAADEDGSFRYQLARSYQATGQAEQARLALAEYQKLREASPSGSEAPGEEASITLCGAEESRQA